MIPTKLFKFTQKSSDPKLVINELNKFVTNIKKSKIDYEGFGEIEKIKENNYVVSSLKGASIFFFQINNKKIINIKNLKIGERIRDLKFYQNKLYLFLEDTASIGIIVLN